MISSIILSSLFNNKPFARKVLPHIQDDYWESVEKKKIFNYIKTYIIKYRNLPTKSTLMLELTKDETLNETLFVSLRDAVEEISNYSEEQNLDWLVDKAEEWCKERALHNAIINSVQIIEDKKPTGSIPELIRKALQVEFDSSIGISLLDQEGIDERWKLYQKKDTKFSTNIHNLDLVFSGGIEGKSLTVLMAGTNAGKSSALVALGSNFIKNGYDVLYITLEMAEEKIAQRFDANNLDVDINDVPMMKEKNFKSRLSQISDKIKGELIIKEYPPASIGTNKIRALLEELKIKKNFKPQIIIVDYLNLMVSDRVKSDSSYTIIKSITEELRGLAVEEDYALLSATQGNRATNDENNSDMDLTNVSESIGLAATVDALIGIIFPADLREQGIQIWKVLKNRFGGIVNHKFPLRVNFARAGLYDIADGEINIQGVSEKNNIALRQEENRNEKKKAVELDFSDIEEEVDNLLE